MFLLFLAMNKILYVQLYGSFMDIICFKTKHAVPKLSRSVIEDFCLHLLCYADFYRWNRHFLNDFFDFCVRFSEWFLCYLWFLCGIYVFVSNCLFFPLKPHFSYSETFFSYSETITSLFICNIAPSKRKQNKLTT